MLLFFKRNWQREVLCWTLFSPARRGWWEMWISKEALAATTLEWWSLRAVRRVHKKLASLDFWRADFGLFRDLFSRIPQDKDLERRGAQESLLRSKDHLWSNASWPRGSQRREPGGLRGGTRCSWTNSNTKKKPTECGSKEEYTEIVWASRVQVRKAKAQLTPPRQGCSV